MRWPPVIFTIGTSYLSATSAMRRSSAAVVTPPKMRGMTLNVPSFCMLAWTRSLMNRASRSSSYSFPQIVFSSDASPALLPASSRPPASAANTDDTLRRPRSRIAVDESGLLSGTPGT